MAPAKSSTEVLKHVCKLMKQPNPKYFPVLHGCGCFMHVMVMNSFYIGKIGGSLAESRADAATNGLKRILEENSGLKKDEIVQEYVARSEIHTDEAQVPEPSPYVTEYVEALISMRDVKIDIIIKAMRKHRNKEVREKFMSMGIGERTKWLQTLE